MNIVQSKVRICLSTQKRFFQHETMWEKHHYKTKICILQWIRFHQSLISKNINVKNLTHLHCIEAEM